MKFSEKLKQAMQQKNRNQSGQGCFRTCPHCFCEDDRPC